MRNRIILSVRKIMSETNLKQPAKAKEKQQEAGTTKNEPCLSLNKHKSTYALACVKSISQTEPNTGSSSL